MHPAPPSSFQPPPSSIQLISASTQLYATPSELLEPNYRTRFPQRFTKTLLIVSFDLIFTIIIFANFVKPIVKTITLFHATNTNSVTVAIQYFLKLMNPLNCSDLRYSVKLQGCNRLSEMCTIIDQYRHVAKLIFQN